MLVLIVSCRSCQRHNQFKRSNVVMIVVVLLIACSRSSLIQAFCRGAHSDLCG